MNAISKSLVIFTTLVALAIEINLAAYGVGQLLYIATAGFILAFLLGDRLRNIVAPAILLVIYLTPALIMAWSGRDHTSHEVAWMAPLLGLVLSGRSAWTWNIPRPWLWPLALWALIVSVSAPIVMFREVGFAPWIFNLARVSNTSFGISPNESISWVAYVVIGHNAGLLWFDWLYRCYDKNRSAFIAEVAAPLAVGLSLACIVGVYQGFVDIGFLSGHSWPHMGRAAGMLMDANAFGMLAAMWGPAFLALTQLLRSPASFVVGAGGLALAFAGVYVSGSRTALVALAIGLIPVVYQAWRWWRAADDRSKPLAKRLLPVVIAIAALGFVFLVIRGSSTTSIVARGSLGFIPGIGDLPIQESLRQLTDRFGYGRAASLMIWEHPWSGVGVGSFLTLVHDYAGSLGLDIPPDNAQNWFRQQVAELGILGSLACFGWCLLFLRALATRTRDTRFSPSAGVLRGSLIALGLVSLVGVAGQATPIVITFWTFAFWYLSVVERPNDFDSASQRHSLRGATWAVVLAVVAVHAATTYAAARGDLLPQHRAQRFGWYYRYGLHDLERPRDGGRGRIWTMKESLAVIPVEGRVLKFVCWIDHPDSEPVTVKVWADSKLVLSSELRKGENAAIDIPAPPGERRMIIETSVSRTFRPSDHGSNDTRELGLAMADWHWE
jgi:hypothetical protein